ncbi:HET-domain-containing protein [Massarina eburnea CBS 473.64]|uniref:HET-domain-containing protein n=1 Tax=Massarina eburnea CBS 473.64 TaxID=1395130 RepID=A0A6A6RL11_9PLEO|nr:HET-domain-containing protein [Massarina eburnea CBS 473.64]
MRLINCETMRFKEFIGDNIPEYGILSHTWDSKEVSYQDYVALQDLTGLSNHSTPAIEKILGTCAEAKKDSLKYVWIDSCCINKESSAELTEAINSMYKWYKKSKRCYVYLSDFKLDVENPDHRRNTGKYELTATEVAELTKCRWFRRGWTLQELLAPEDIIFFNHNWKCFGSKHNLETYLSSITRIPCFVLVHSNSNRIYRYSIAQRMSWAAKRITTRGEDMAYCLFGIFDVNLPLLYGEGLQKAFIRLQEAIIKKSNELTIFAWKSNGRTGRSGILATSPDKFVDSGDIVSCTWADAKLKKSLYRGIPPDGTAWARKPSWDPEFIMTNKGLRIDTDARFDSKGSYIMLLNCVHGDTIKRDGVEDFQVPVLGIFLDKDDTAGTERFCRSCPNMLPVILPDNGDVWVPLRMYIAKT